MSGRTTSSVDPPGHRRLRVLVADADSAFAGALGAVLGRDPALEVVGVATSVREAAHSVEQSALDVALVGEFPGRELDELVAGLRAAPRVAVVVLVGPEWEESRAPGDLEPAAFLRREATAEETLRGFFEVAVFAVAVQLSRSEPEP